MTILKRLGALASIGLLVVASRSGSGGTGHGAPRNPELHGG